MKTVRLPAGLSALSWVPFPSIMTRFECRQMSHKRPISTLTSSFEVLEVQEAFNRTRFTLARKRRGWTKGKLADAIGVDVRAVSAYEAGEYLPSRDTLGKAADALT